jgi:hypothetical protein
VTQNASFSRQGVSGSSGAVLSIRLWTSKEDTGTDDSFWKSNAPSACLAMDLIQASQGAPVTTHGKILIANFSGIQAAISAARRIQWALSGLSEVSNFDSTAAAILIYSPAGSSVHPQDNLPVTPLEQASPGQILFTAETCQSLEDLPGLPLLPPSSIGLRELQWCTSENKSNRSSDEKTLAQLMQQHGLEDPEPDRPEPLLAAPVPVSQLSPVPFVAQVEPLPLLPAAPNVLMLHLQGWIARLREMPIWLIATACAVPLLLTLVILVIVRNQSTSKLPAAPPQRAKTVTGMPPTPTTSTVPHTETPHLSKTQNMPAEKHPLPPAKPKTQPENCTLNQTEIPAALRGAEVSFQNGKYSDAERKFRSVLACSQANPVAMSGLNRAQLAQHTQDLRPKQ